MAIDTGVISLFLHPPIGLVKQESIGNVIWTGAGNFTRPRLVVPIGEVGVDAFGIRWSLPEVPPGYGSTPGPRANVYDRPMLGLAVVHRLSDGAEVTTQETTINQDLGHILFEESFPLAVYWKLAPGVGARFWWLVRPLAS